MMVSCPLVSRLLRAATSLALLLLSPHSAMALRYNEVQMKNSHNSYERKEGLLDQMIYFHLRSIEIDCHLSSNPGEFRVFHDAGYLQSYSSLSTLLDGVKTLLEFNRLFPKHHVVSIFVDIKGGITGSRHKPEDFDDTIGLLPLFTPADLRPNNESSIEAGIGANGWPDIDDMRGKFIWVITTGQSSYCADDVTCNSRKAFVSTKATTEDDIGKESYSVFYNQPSTQSEMAPLIRERGFISRIYDLSDIDSQEKWDKAAISDRFMHIATDKVNFHKDTFGKTHNAYGFPFRALDGSDVSELDGDEGGSVMHMYANNGDMWGRQDDAIFAYVVDDTTNEWVEYTTSISLTNSHCKKFAKAGIFVREEDERFPIGTGQYFAVVRTCEESMRVQYRELAYLYTAAKRLARPRDEDVVFDGIEGAKRMSVKLRYRYDGQNSTAEGYYRLEGTDQYVLIDRRVFPDTQLMIHGVFTSSHYWNGNADGTDFKALFVNTKRNDELLTASNFTVYPREEGFKLGDGYFGPNDGSVARSTDRRLFRTSLRGESMVVH